MVLVAGTWPTVPGVREMAVLAGFGVVQMAIPYTLFARGLREIPAPEAGLIGLLEPVLNPIWVWLVHGEVPAPATLVGGSLLLVGVAVRYVPRGHRARRGA
jgi:drug/metabolite transporter (DMT)-like permease